MFTAKNRSALELLTTVLYPLFVIIKAICAVILAIYFGR